MCPLYPRKAHLSGTRNKSRYAYEMATSSVRVGPGVIREVGMDVANAGAKRCVVVTDPQVGQRVPLFVDNKEEITRA